MCYTVLLSFSVKLHEIALLFVKHLFTGYWDPGQHPCGVFYHAHMISSPFAPPISLFSSKECWENIVKLSLRFIFCQDKVLGKLFHSQDECYWYGIFVYNFFFPFLPTVSDSDQITLGIVSNVLKMWKKSVAAMLLLESLTSSSSDFSTSLLQWCGLFTSASFPANCNILDPCLCY